MSSERYPLREIKKLADAAFVSMDELLEPMHAESGRPSIPPERLLKSMPPSPPLVDARIHRQSRTRNLTAPRSVIRTTSFSQSC